MLTANLLGLVLFAADKGKNNPSPSPTISPIDTPAVTESGNTAEGPVIQAIDWVTAHPIPVLIVAAIIGVTYGWKQLRLYNRQRGKATPPLTIIIKRAIRFGLIEDRKPFITKPAGLAKKLKWFQWRFVYLIVLATAVGLWLVGRNDLILAVGVVSFILYFRARGVFQRRHSILMQMFNVAASDFRYPKGSDLNPWSYINISKWEDMYRPGQTTVIYPAGFQSEDLNAREKFERNFSGSVSDENSFTYEWKSAQNRVVASPTPYLPSVAKYPGYDDHPWNEFPLGLTWGGKEAILDVTVTPHALIAGPTGSGKNLDLKSKIPTPSGWTTMGKIKVGDKVLDDQGKPTTVMWVSDINEQPDLYAITFSDGSVIKADADHLWWTETRNVHMSKWDQRRSVVERRSLVDEVGLSALRRLLAEAGKQDEITLADFAAIAGIAPTTAWFRSIADELGHVGEVQTKLVCEYAEQVVTQRQVAQVFNAREAWAALATFMPKYSRWYAQRKIISGFLEAAADGEEVSSVAMATALGTTRTDVDRVLKANGVFAVRSEGPRGPACTSFYSAGAAWKAFLSAASHGIPEWVILQPEFARLATAASETDIVIGRDVAELIGLARSAEAAHLLKKIGVRFEKREILVDLAVPAQTIVKDGDFARTYLTRELAERTISRALTPAHDQRHKLTAGSVKTTLEILESLNDKHGYANHSIPIAGPLDLPEVDLPISPYTLGVWLGDGSSRRDNFVGIDHEIADFIRFDGHELSEQHRPDYEGRHSDYRVWSILGLSRHLREAGILQRNTAEGSRKQIPAIYLRASIEQRRALLAGLLDTDGTVAPQGTVQFTNTNLLLATQTRELALSLGYRATIISGIKAAQTGTECLAFTVSWTCKESPFRLSRKTQTHTERNINFSEDRNGSRFVQSITKVPSEPARCIAVDAPSRLFLAGESMIPTHNSVVQRIILLHALQSPRWRVVGIDPKMVELAPYKDFANILKVATTLEEEVATLESAVNEMRRRYEEMKDQVVNHFTDLPNDPVTGEPIPALLVLIDETYALLAPENIKSDEGKERDGMHARCTVLIGDIARLGRAAGVHLVAATQRPDAKVLPGETRNNLDARIACSRMDTTPSLMVLDSDHATRLPLIKGRSVLRLGGEIKEYQGYFVPIEQVAGIVQNGLARNIARQNGLEVDSHETAESGGGKPTGKPAGVSAGGKGPKGLWARMQAAASESDEALGAVQGVSSNVFVESGEANVSRGFDSDEEFNDDSFGSVSDNFVEPGEVVDIANVSPSGYPLSDSSGSVTSFENIVQPRASDSHLSQVSIPEGMSPPGNGWYGEKVEQEIINARLAAGNAKGDDVDFENVFGESEPTSTDPYPIDATDFQAPLGMGDVNNLEWSGDGQNWGSDETPIEGLFDPFEDLDAKDDIVEPEPEVLLEKPKLPVRRLTPISLPIVRPTQSAPRPVDKTPVIPPVNAPTPRQLPPARPTGQPPKQFPPRRGS